MQQQKRTLRTTLSRWRYLASLGLGALIVLFVVQQASAGPITNPGGAPYAKLSVYQGVLSIVPNGSGDSVMEIGNAGRDIKSTGDVNIIPSGDVHITTGRLCFGSGTGSCSNTWGGTTTSTLDAALAAGNKSNASVILGNGTGSGTGVALLDASNTASIDKDALSGKSSRANRSGLYAQNTGGGYAGYFSGTTGIFTADATGPVGGWPLNSLVRIANTSDVDTGGYALDVRNESTGWAASFSGAVRISGQANSSSAPYDYQQHGLVNIVNSGATGLWVSGGNAATFIGGDTGATTALVAAAGTSLGSRAAQFRGAVAVEGSLALGISTASGFPVRTKSQWGIQVCRLYDDSCVGGQYIYTNYPSRAGAQYCYEDVTNRATVCTNIFNSYTRIPTCTTAGYSASQRRPWGVSYYIQANCAGAEYEDFNANPSQYAYGPEESSIYGTTGTPICKQDSPGTIQVLSYRNSKGCTNQTAAYSSYLHLIGGGTTTNFTAPDLELR